MIYLIRHGETVWNQQGLVQGSLDTPLTTKGMQQAREMGRKMQGHVPQLVLISPAFRAQSTYLYMSMAGKITVTGHTSPLLREKDWGRWEGLTLEEFRDRKSRPEYLDHLWDYKDHEGESYQEFVNRLVRFWRTYDDNDMMVVAHQTVNAVSTALLCGMHWHEGPKAENHEMIMVDREEKTFEVRG